VVRRALWRGRWSHHLARYLLRPFSEDLTHPKFFTEDHSSSPKGVSLPILVRMSLGRSRFGQPLALDDVHGLLVRGSGNLEVAD
jgi:hypothetical protein